MHTTRRKTSEAARAICAACSTDFSDVALAVAAYNAGPAAVERYGGFRRIETRNYVRNVLTRYRARSQLGNLTTNGGSQPAGIIVP